jgi:hypothetical protein
VGQGHELHSARQTVVGGARDRIEAAEEHELLDLIAEPRQKEDEGLIGEDRVPFLAVRDVCVGGQSQAVEGIGTATRPKPDRGRKVWFR